ncbi:MAG: GNAT family N-acetyltransferase [Dermatophilaceae bacterium]
MTRADLLARYDRELRAEAEVRDADEVTRIGPLWCATFPARGRGFISYAALGPEDDVEALIAGAVAHYAADERVQRFEWKTRGHDAVPHLLDRLAAHGFVIEEVETVMAGPAEQVAEVAGRDGLPEGYRIEQATTEATVREAEALAGLVFGDTADQSAGLADELVARMQAEPDSFEMWLVRGPSGEVVCSGRVDFVDGTEFAGLWGGACHVDHRGKGLYRALTAARARSALARGKRVLQSDCTEHSRPILERAGLVPITTSTPAIWHRSAAPAHA